MGKNVEFKYEQGTASIALKLPGYYVWDNSVIKADGKYWMFSSRWEYEKGFGWNWCFNSRVILSVSDTPEGPFKFVKEILPRRGRDYFDGMNTHNTCIKEYDGKYYLYYMGTTYDYPVPNTVDDINEEMIDRTWKNKRIGLAVADKIDGDYVRRDTPLFDVRPYPAWDSTVTTNPTVIIKPDGKTVMVYKSSRCSGHILHDDNALKLGVAVADNPNGPYTRKFNDPISFEMDGKKISIEDPCIWFDSKRNKYCLIFKDCHGNITGEFGDMIYGESSDLETFEFLKDRPAFTLNVTWKDGSKSKQCNLERPFILLGDDGEPEYLYCSSGDGEWAYHFEGETYIVCLKINKVK